MNAPMRMSLSLMLIVMSLTGCSSSGSNSNKTASASEQPAFTRTGDGTITQAVLVDGKIQMPSFLPAGRTLIKVINNDKKFRNFRIIGDGVDASILDGLQSGQAGELLVELHPGKYIVVCPTQGLFSNTDMRHELTVTN